MMKEYSNNTANRFRKLFRETTGLDLSLKQFIKFCKMQTQKDKVDYFLVDYRSLYNLILERTDIPLQ